MRMRRWMTGTTGLALVALALPVGNTWAQAAATAEELKAGKSIYVRACTSCHGDQGKGDGLAAPLLDPRPRDFTRGLFKFRSTASGKVPILDDLARTLTHGLTGTAMGQWRGVSAHNRRARRPYFPTLFGPI